MPEGTVVWSSKGSTNTLLFDAGYESERAEIHIYEEVESLTVEEAMQEIVESEYTFEKESEEVDREFITERLLKARGKGSSSKTWDILD
mgnify:CR=1 FL=1